MRDKASPDSTAGREQAANEARLHAFLEAAVDAILRLDERGLIQFANPAA